MPYDISGNFSRVYDFETDRTNGIPIMSARVDGEFDGIAQGLTEAFCRDGRAAMTGNLRMGNYRLTGLGDGSLASPAIQFGSETNTGIYRVGAGAAAIVIQGTERVQVNTTGVGITGTLAVSGNITGAAIGGTSVTASGAVNGATGVFSGNVSVGGTLTVVDDPYGAGWNGSLLVATKNAIYDQMELRASTVSPAFTGVPTAPTAAVDTNTTQIATTAYVVGQGYAKLAGPTFTGVPAAPTAAVDTNTTQLATTAYVVGQGYAKLASPALTGTPTAPTAGAGTNTTQLATCAFVTAAANLKADLASPALTGTPTAPTAAFGTNTTQLATCAFVDRLRGVPGVASGGALTADATHRGKCITATGNITFNTPVFAADDTVTVYANQAGTLTLIQGAGVTMRLAGSATTGTRTLAGRGFATVYWISAAECVVSGNVT